MRNGLKPNVCQKRGYWYYRLTHGSGANRKEQYIRLPPPGTPEHDQRYWEIRSGKYKPEAKKTTWGNLAKLYFGSPAYQSKKPRTRADYRKYIEDLLQKNAAKDVCATRRSDVVGIHEKLSETPRKADHYLAVIKILLNFAVSLEWIATNPAKGVRPFGTQSSFEPWPEPLQQAYLDLCGDNTTAFLAFHLGTGTGQRPGDLVRMEWSHFDGEYMHVVQEKTGARVWVYCPERLREALASVPRRGRFVLAKSLTEPMTYDAVEKMFRKVRDAIETDNRLTMHGWRYTAAVELAEAGCSDAEIQSVTGHKTLEMVQKYRAQARAKELSKAAQIRREQNKNKP